MIEALAPDIESNIEQYFSTSHKSVYEKNIADIEKTQVLLMFSANIRATKAFFKDILEYHGQMNLSNSAIEHIVAGLDTIIDEFLPLTEKTSTDKIESDYYNLVKEFVDVMVDTQVELGFYKVERQAV